MTNDEAAGMKFYLEKVKPLHEKGMTSKEIAARLKISEKEADDLIEEWTKPYCHKVGSALFAEVVELLKRHVHFELESYARLLALFCLQSAVAVGLPGVFYIAIPGGKGSGKTNLLTIVRVLTNGKMFENISIAALARSIKKGTTVCMDEFDVERGKEENEVRDALIRQGYKADGSKYTRWDATKKELEEISVYGPKIVAYRGRIDPALLDRSYVIPVEKYLGDDGYEFTRLGIWPEVSDLSVRIAEWGKDAMITFPPDKLKELGQKPEFKEAVKKTTESFGASRGTELATYANLVGFMIGIDVSEDVAISDRIRLVEDESADEQAEVQQAILNVLKESDGQKALASIAEIRIVQKDVKSLVDRWHKERDEKPLSDARFKILRREIGIKEAWVRRPGNRNVWVIPAPYILTLQANMDNMANLKEKPVQQDLDVSQVSQVSLLRQDANNGMPYDKLVEKYGSELVEREKIPKIGGRG
jgi:hypothetical protein